MAFKVFDSAGEGAYFVVLIVSAIFTLVALALRLWATRLSDRKLGLEDWLATAAVGVFLIRVGVVLRCLTILNGRSTALADDHLAYSQAFQLILVADEVTMLDQSFAKWSICALYYRIFGVNRSYRRWIWAVAIVQGIVNVALIVVQFLQCRPLHKFWQFWAAGDCMPFAVVLVGLGPPNSVLDFALVVLAMCMVHPLHLKPSSKWKLRALFGLGSIAGIIGFVKIGFGYNPDREYASASVGLWAVLQSVASIVCCCAPVYKPLLPEHGVWRFLSTKFSLSRSIKLALSSVLTRSSRSRRVAHSDNNNNNNATDTPEDVESDALTLDEYQQNGQGKEQEQQQAWPAHAKQVDPMGAIPAQKTVHVVVEAAGALPEPSQQQPQEEVGLHSLPAAYAGWGRRQPMWNAQWQQPYMVSTWPGQPNQGQYGLVWNGQQYVPAVQVQVWDGLQAYVQAAWNGYQQPQGHDNVYAAQPQATGGEGVGMQHTQTDSNAQQHSSQEGSDDAR